MLLTKAREQVTNKWCLRCKHHSSYHQLITRDKWNELGGLIERGRIPWFCEFVVSAEAEEDEKMCACTDFQPTDGGMTS